MSWFFVLHHLFVPGNSNGGHMIQFQLFDSSRSYQCHFGEIATFVVSIAHYMRAYFNYEALKNGKDFGLPEDAAFLACHEVQLGDDYDGINLYAKIGCMERATFSSTRLQLHFYTDAQCMDLYDDDRSSREHATQGYMVGDDGDLISSAVSFRVPFYSCATCYPRSISGTFNKRNNNWYDDKYISVYGEKQNWEGNGQEENDDANQGDDAYMVSNDDINYDDARFNDDKVDVNYDNYNGNRALLSEQEVMVRNRQTIRTRRSTPLLIVSHFYVFHLNRTMKLSSGTKLRNREDCMRITTILETGTFAKESTNMAFGVMQTVAPLTLQINGRHRIFSFSPSCVRFWLE